MTEYDVLILGSSTWGEGELQDDWYDVIDRLSGLDLKGKKVALFGTGDQKSYPDTFVDALAELKEKLAGTGAAFIGAWPVEGYDYDSSRSEEDGMFVGLALDDDNQPDKTEERIAEWVGRLKEEIG
jgi:flavodoxin I